MLNKILKITFVLFCIVILSYLALPSFSFPTPPPDSLQSKEPADSETSLRRAYFTNYSRAEVLAWYENQFKESKFLGMSVGLPTLLLNYPPEDSQAIIRDQTMSTYLQEVVLPLRESLYINGFEPKEAKDAIFIEDRPWNQKIIIRYVPVSLWVRIGAFAATVVLMVILFGEWRKFLTNKKS